MIINKAYKYRIYPTKEQQVLLEKHFDCCRFIFNYFLNRRKTAYVENKLNLNYYKLADELTQLKNKEEYKWLKEVNSQALQMALRNLDVAYNNFFTKHTKFPRFKSKKDNNKSFNIPQFIKVEGNKLYVPKFKDGITVKQHRKFEGKICSATISKNCRNKYFVSIIVEEDYKSKVKNTDKSIGIDVGIKDLVITSDGVKFKNPNFLKVKQKKLKYNQRQLSKKKKGSKSRDKQRIKLNKYFEKVDNCRSNYLHKVTNQLVNENQVIVAESLNVIGMMKNHNLAGSIGDCSWSELFRQLKYKCKWNNRTLYQIDKFFPSSKTCNHCGFVKQDLTLKDREWECPNCHNKLDRDINASMNILKQGLNEIKNLGLGNKSKYKQKQVEALSLDESMKPEAQQL